MGIIYFIKSTDHSIHKMQSEKRVIQSKSRHILILDGYKSHINLMVPMKARENGIEMINFCNSHKL